MLTHVGSESNTWTLALSISFAPMLHALYVQDLVRFRKEDSIGPNPQSTAACKLSLQVFYITDARAIELQ